MAQFTITAAQSRSVWYRRALLQEVQSRDTEESLRKCPINHPAVLEYKAELLGGQPEVKDYADWTEFLVSEYGPRKSCFSLGSGLGRVERYLIRRGFTDSFEAIELCPDLVEASMHLEGRIAAVVGDLNFVQLAPERYDFVLCHGVLHHLINLEHVLDQINQSLKHDGLLLVYEYVGPTRCQYPEPHLRYLRSLFPEVRLSNKPVWRVTGFESVRSGDVLPLIQAQFGTACERAVNFGAGYHPIIHCAPWAKTTPYIHRVIELDRQVTQSGRFPPSYHMGLYHRSEASPLPATPWSDQRLRQELAPEIPLLDFAFHCASRALRAARCKARIRSRIRSFLKSLGSPGAPHRTTDSRC